MSKTVVIDAGHYTGYNPYPAAKGYSEGNQMWKLAGYLKSSLERCGVKVILTKSSCGENPGLTTRGATAGRNYADIFLSLHSNAVSSAVNDNVTGVEVYHSIFNGSSFASALALTVSSIMNTKNRGAKTRRGSGNWDYYSVIKGAVDSGCKEAYLIEHGFHTSHKDASFLIVDSNLKKIAEAEGKVICEHLGISFVSDSVPTQTGTPTDNSFLVRVIDKNLNIRSGPSTAYRVVGQIRDGGVYTIVETKGTVGKAGSWGKLKSGAGWISLNKCFAVKV